MVTKTVKTGIIVGTLLVVAIFTTQQQQVFAWNLSVDLTQSTFGSDEVCVSIKRAFGYYRESCTEASPYASVSFNIPEDAVPDGYNYRVCVWGGALSGVFKNCQMYSHGSGDEGVQRDVGG
jgi:hypothetical protein